MEASRSSAYQQNRFEMLTPAGLEVQIFVDSTEAKSGDCFYGAPVVKARLRRLDSKAKGNRGNHELGFGLFNGGIVSLPPFEAPHISA